MKSKVTPNDIKLMEDKAKIQRKQPALKDQKGKSIKCLGTWRLNVKVKGKVQQLLFSVVADLSHCWGTEPVKIWGR